MKLFFLLTAFISVMACYGNPTELDYANWKTKWICYEQNGTETLRVDSSWLTVDGMSNEWIQVVMKSSHSIETFSFLSGEKISGLSVLKNDDELIVQFKRKTGDSNGCYIGTAIPNTGAFSIYGDFGCKGYQRSNTVKVITIKGQDFAYAFGNYGGHCEAYGY
ncbi:MAG: hypothetical protein A2504_17200 [Bdellovibrionales bacterium RIFOXYD12_FULL_39_22]|nr:MAG: hypothetical protein A2385_10760 [Bdellovibrionales bacterium RIFOXYB1_FULL_39_21]OFZ40743.1 MAG: hypothetical protein A2485_16970 [Bdellovibrionales bacterium RIFOXYC12_FULL_39_17]OFZ48165.1 MAG: hypothetical protein A2404_17130 [Bdellovibrionales bacterium RIFOXYC1_FULL_39_130]OFZ75815.1 MAG: hypothetical protein A2560_13630 [Bdellovibrionales bacterium RIFOXYD1_FULL_39_84]OFZ76130.1 MAG: hypothetical protein A2451_11875 [Bdellovibrionales bacterium RIFOXYC2_FULL_39_8]OFZ91876.1 MAG: